MPANESPNASPALLIGHGGRRPVHHCNTLRIAMKSASGLLRSLGITSTETEDNR
jgi:hypothetical protein